MLTERFCPAQQAAKCTSLAPLPAGGRGGWASGGGGEVEAWSQPWLEWRWEHSQEEWEEYDGGILHGHLPAQSKPASGVTGTRARKGEHREDLQPPWPQVPGGWFRISPPKYDLIIFVNICSPCPKGGQDVPHGRTNPFPKRSQHFQNFS